MKKSTKPAKEKKPKKLTKAQVKIIKWLLEDKKPVTAVRWLTIKGFSLSEAKEHVDKLKAL